MLTASQIAKLAPGRHHDGGGLYLVVGKSSGRSWIFRFRRDGKLRDHGLGPLHSVTLAAARQRAFECRAALYAGSNPIEKRQAARLERVIAAAKRVTFEAAAEHCIAAKAAGWRGRKHEQAWRQSLSDYAYPVLGKLPVAAIDTELVMRVLTPIWQSNTETASRLRNRIEIVLDWATTKTFRTGDNPARWRGHLENLLAAPKTLKQRKPRVALPFAEVAGFMTSLRQQQSIPARALEFAILTATRSDEVRLARWCELDLAERAWLIPGERMKAGKEHRVALSDAALELLAALPRCGDYVFPGRDRARPFGPAEMRRAVEKAGAAVDVHGFRSTFRDWASEMTTHPREVAEIALAHKVGNDVELAYRRGDLFEKRRALMADWATWCAGGAVVLPFPTLARASAKSRSDADR
jgi:integrase